MKTSAAQIDLFDDAPGYRESPRPEPRKRQAALPAEAGWDAEEAAQRLKLSGRFRILRKLVPRPIVPRAQSAFPNLAILVDTETTGLNHAKDEVIKIGAVARARYSRVRRALIAGCNCSLSKRRGGYRAAAGL